MPNQNQPDPNQNQEQGSLGSVPFSPQADLPPLPPEFQNLGASPAPTAIPTPPITPIETAPVAPMAVPTMDSGSAAPPAPAFSDITSSPKKKFGTGKIIATILGIFVLVGGVAAATLLTGQKQLFQQKATTFNCGYDASGNVNGNFCTTNCAVGHSQTGNCNTGYCCNLEAGSGVPAITPVATPVGTGVTCEQNGFTCVVGGCPAGSYSQQGICNNGACCSSPTSTPKSGWGTETACRNVPGTTGDHCILITCPNGCVGGCSEDDPGATVESGDCDTLAARSANLCAQVDLVNASGVYCDSASTNAQINCPQPKCAVSTPNNPSSTPVSTPISTPTTPAVAPFCAAISTYDSDWNLLSSTDRSALKAGDTINFCVTGSAASGAFDMAKFIINAVEQATTTARRPNSTDFCQSYTLPSGTTTFTVSGQIHHVTLGWF